MRSTRLLSGMAAVAMVLAGAPAAQAAEYTVSACQFIDYQFPSGSVVTIVYGEGCSPDTFVDANDDPLNVSIILGVGNADIVDAFGEDPGTPSVITLLSGDAWLLVLSTPGADRYVQQWIGTCGAFSEEYYSQETIDAGWVIDRSACPTDQTPVPIEQAVPLPASGLCADVADADFGFQARLVGGWSASWAQWANGGAGGPVCVRTLRYSNTLGAWTVQQ